VLLLLLVLRLLRGQELLLLVACQISCKACLATWWELQQGQGSSSRGSSLRRQAQPAMQQQ
jgi:hypothetical protein